MQMTEADLLDLSGCTFAAPGGIVALACEVKRQEAAGRTVRLEAPRNFDVACWLDRMDVPNLVPGGCASGFPGVQRHPQRHRLVELVEIQDDESEIEHMAELVVNRVGLEGQARSELYLSLYELALNVCEHSGTPGFIAAQTYQDHVEVAIGDWGRGVRASLAGAGHRFKSDTHALLAASTTDLSSKPTWGGKGLLSVIKNAKGVAKRHGRPARVGLWSGNGALKFHSSRDDPVVQRVRHHQGTIARLEVPC